MLTKDEFFEAMERQGLALTYGDVRMHSGPSDVSPSEVDISSRFSRNTKLNTPFASAAMDTVTTSNMAIAMAKLGGIGIIHAGLTVSEQRQEVRRVKLHLNGLVERPITVRPDQKLADVLRICDMMRFNFRSFPVVDDEDRLLGVLTQSGFDFSEDPENELVESAMTPDCYLTKASAGTSINDAYGIMKEHRRKLLPLTDERGKLAGMYILSDVLRIMRDNPHNYNLDQAGRLITGAAVPTDPEEAEERVRAMADYLDVVVVDTAQGDSKYSLRTLRHLKETVVHLKESFRGLDVVVGNISEAESALLLAQNGADGIKVGQGPGSICTTRIETGIGMPQVTAVFECAKAIRGMGIPVCADGGITNPSDVSIAIASGAHSVMIGSKFAGTKESPGDIIQLDDGTMVKPYRGMGSPSALRDSAASRKRYSVGMTGIPLAEGVESYVPYKGSVAETVNHFISALRKSMSYMGRPDIEAHRTHTRLSRITNAGMLESGVHDVRAI